MVRWIGLWAFVGFAVGVCWAFFFAVIFGHSLSYSLRTARLTSPSESRFLFHAPAGNFR
jgi:hypothetical protein